MTEATADRAIDSIDWIAVSSEKQMDITGKVAVITGGASGIGRAVAIAAAAQGMTIVLADIDVGSLVSGSQARPAAAAVGRSGRSGHAVATGHRSHTTARLYARLEPSALLPFMTA